MKGTQKTSFKSELFQLATEWLSPKFRTDDFLPFVISVRQLGYRTTGRRIFAT